jgi:two-component system, response regulator PdtaR
MRTIASPQKPLVLVVDDEYLVRMTLVDQLEDAGYPVLEAENADAALNVLASQAEEVQVVFTDLNMPGSMDGLALVEEVHRRWPHILLLLASGKEDLNNSDVSDDGQFLPKPFLRAGVVRTIDDMIQKLGRSSVNQTSV